MSVTISRIWSGTNNDHAAVNIANTKNYRDQVRTIKASAPQYKTGTAASLPTTPVRSTTPVKPKSAEQSPGTPRNSGPMI